MSVVSHVERLVTGDTFEFLTPAATISGRVVFVTVDYNGQLFNVELSMPLVDGKVPGRHGPDRDRLNIPGLAISAYWKVPAP